MTQFSANLGFLWPEKSLPDAIHAAKKAGFDAVECHWPYQVNAVDVKAALNDTGMDMLSINTSCGDVDKGENGICAIPGRESESRLVIDEAIDYAMQIGAQKIHVMAGFAQGADAHQQFKENLAYAISRVAGLPISLLIEPLNKYDAPNYFLSTTLQAETIIEEIDSAKLEMIFDCFHVQLMQGNLSGLFERHFKHIGHVQFASVPDRGPPDVGEINFASLFEFMGKLGYASPLGAEYKPVGDTDASLGWLNKFA